MRYNAHPVEDILLPCWSLHKKNTVRRIWEDGIFRRARRAKKWRLGERKNCSNEQESIV